MKMRAVYIAIPVLPTLFGYGLNALLAAAITGGLSGLVGPFYVLLHIGFLILWFFSGWPMGKQRCPKEPRFCWAIWSGWSACSFTCGSFSLWKTGGAIFF